MAASVDRANQRIIDFMRGTDIVAYDAMFTDEKFPLFVNWVTPPCRRRCGAQMLRGCA